MSNALAPTAGSRLPRQRRDRRAALSALALLLVVAGGLGAALVVYRSGHRVDVLVAAKNIQVGQQVTSDDFTVARVSSDASGSVLKSESKRNFVGTFATTTIPTGTLLNRLMFQVGNVVPAGGVVIGVTVSQSQRPAAAIDTGDVVRAYSIPKSGASDTAAPGPVLVEAARVVGVSTSSSTSSGSETVSLLVESTAAQMLVTAAGQGTVALGTLPPATKPTIDFRATR